jgi:hypothetical protein
MGTCDRSLVRKVDDSERTVDGLPDLWLDERRPGVAVPDEVKLASC